MPAAAYRFVLTWPAPRRVQWSSFRRLPPITRTLRAESNSETLVSAACLHSEPLTAKVWQAKPNDTGAGVLIWIRNRWITLRGLWQCFKALAPTGLRLFGDCTIRRLHEDASLEHARISALWPGPGKLLIHRHCVRNSSTGAQGFTGARSVLEAYLQAPVAAAGRS
jgi:hypothetical protein